MARLKINAVWLLVKRIKCVFLHLPPRESELLPAAMFAGRGNVNEVIDILSVGW